MLITSHGEIVIIISSNSSIIVTVMVLTGFALKLLAH